MQFLSQLFSLSLETKDKKFKRHAEYHGGLVEKTLTAKVFDFAFNRNKPETIFRGYTKSINDLENEIRELKSEIRKSESEIRNSEYGMAKEIAEEGMPITKLFKLFDKFDTGRDKIGYFIILFGDFGIGEDMVRNLYEYWLKRKENY